MIANAGIVFADTHYWIALLDTRDPWHIPACAASAKLGIGEILTTDEVLVEVLNAFSGRGSHHRRMACELVWRLRRDERVQVLEQSRQSFDQGMIRYHGREDKGYSLVDCISMNVMQQMGISRVLTNDRHFAQEGFDVLIK